MSWSNPSMTFEVLKRFPGFAKDIIRNRNTGANRPRMLTYTVTFRCNARCIMCDSWKMKGKGDLELSEIERIFQQIGKLDAVRLTGGEPFVRDDFADIFSLTVKHLRPFGIHITTNGFLTDRIVHLCENRSLRTPLQLMVSLDGVQDYHNKIRGSTQAWNLAFKTLEHIAPRRKKLNIDLVVNQTIVNAEGIEQYRKLRDLLKPMGVPHQAVMAYGTSATYNLQREVDLAPKEVGEFSTHGGFSQADLQVLFDEVESDIQELPFASRIAKQYYWRGIKQRLMPSTTNQEWLNPECVALHSHLRIYPNGDIPTCQFNSKTIGNLKETPFQEVWDSITAKAQRKWVRDCVGCWAECEVLPNAIYTLDIVRPKKRTINSLTPVANNESPEIEDAVCDAGV